MKKVLTLIALAVGVLFGASAGTAHAYPPTVTITGPGTVAPGAAFTVVASGLTPGSTVLGTPVDSSNTQVTEGTFVTVDANGTATFTVTAPSTPGNYGFVVNYYDADGNVIGSSRVSFTVQAEGTNNNGNTNNKPGNGSALPNTGSSSTPLLGVGLAALVGGSALVFISKRRRPSVS